MPAVIAGIIRKALMKQTTVVQTTIIITTLLTLLSCSSIPRPHNLGNTIFYYECKNVNNTSYHYFSNHFTVAPTDTEKTAEVPIAKMRLWCRYSIQLQQCKEIPKSEIPDNLTK